MHLASQLLTSSSHGSIQAVVLSKVPQGVLARLRQLLTGSPHGFIPALVFLKVLQGLLDRLSQTRGGDWSHRLLGCGDIASYDSAAIVGSNHFR